MSDHFGNLKTCNVRGLPGWVDLRRASVGFPSHGGQLTAHICLVRKFPFHKILHRRGKEKTFLTIWTKLIFTHVYEI